MSSRHPYDMVRPCANCPFRPDGVKVAHEDRANEICEANDFPCHKTVDYADDGECHDTNGSKVCAGSLIYHEKRGDPTQMMRIAERLGMYDASSLDMDVDVIEDPDDMVCRRAMSGGDS